MNVERNVVIDVLILASIVLGKYVQNAKRILLKQHILAVASTQHIHITRKNLQRLV